MTSKELQEKLKNVKIALDIGELTQKKTSLEKKMGDKETWEDHKKAARVSKELAAIKRKLDKVSSVEEKINDILAFEGLEKENQTTDKEIKQDLDNLKKVVTKELQELELETLFSGKYDSNDVVLSIHAGQGGTEACDWTEMLLRMYTMYAQKRGWQVAVIDSTSGSNTGYSSVEIEITGENVYGNLKMEKGVHRLVRISPFSAQGTRETTFAGVDVTPIIHEEGNVQIDEKDLDIKTTKASGPGGQGVNTTDSAITITHGPTGITTKCSSTRSQIQNKKKAMEMLRSKLEVLEEEEKEQELENVKGKTLKASWSNQIRNYVLHPYKLVKDLRTGVESNNPEAILSGDLDEFVKAEVRRENKA